MSAALKKPPLPVEARELSRPGLRPLRPPRHRFAGRGLRGDLERYAAHDWRRSRALFRRGADGVSRAEKCFGVGPTGRRDARRGCALLGFPKVDEAIPSGIPMGFGSCTQLEPSTN